VSAADHDHDSHAGHAHALNPDADKRRLSIALGLIVALRPAERCCPSTPTRNPAAATARSADPSTASTYLHAGSASSGQSPRAMSGRAADRRRKHRGHPGLDGRGAPRRPLRAWSRRRGPPRESCNRCRRRRRRRRHVTLTRQAPRDGRGHQNVAAAAPPTPAQRERRRRRRPPTPQVLHASHASADQRPRVNS
jgi:hypothetical protein